MPNDIETAFRKDRFAFQCLMHSVSVVCASKMFHLFTNWCEQPATVMKRKLCTYQEITNFLIQSIFYIWVNKTNSTKLLFSSSYSVPIFFLSCICHENDFFAGKLFHTHTNSYSYVAPKKERQNKTQNSLRRCLIKKYRFDFVLWFRFGICRIYIAIYILCSNVIF